MAVAPLFIETMAKLKAPMRLTGASATDTSAAIDLAVKKVRVFFHQKLGAARVAAIVALTASDNPTTTDEITRSTAEACEAAWVKMLLLQDLPTVFMDGSASAQQNWNQEGLLRDAPQSGIRQQIKDLEAQVQSMLSILEGESEEVSDANVSVIGPDCTNDAPGTGTGVWDV